MGTYSFSLAFQLFYMVELFPFDVYLKYVIIFKETINHTN